LEKAVSPGTPVRNITTHEDANAYLPDWIGRKYTPNSPSRLELGKSPKTAIVLTSPLSRSLLINDPGAGNVRTQHLKQIQERIEKEERRPSDEN